MLGYSYRFSLFTATYNRGRFLEKVYQDLLKQDYKNFEWIIVSDGSIDDTDSIVASFIKEGKIPIQFVKKKNGGKHTAWRAATPLFKGRYVICVDDDDATPPTMVSVFNQAWKKIEDTGKYERIWEIRGRCVDMKGNLVGSEMPDPWDISLNDLVYKYKKGCEMRSSRKVEVLQNDAAVPEEFYFSDKVSNFPEGIRWSRAARKFDSRIISDVVRVYQSEICSESLSKSASGSKKNIYNNMVGCLYSLNEQSDLMRKNRALKIYLRKIWGLARTATKLKENPEQYLQSWFTKLMFYILKAFCKVV